MYPLGGPETLGLKVVLFVETDEEMITILGKSGHCRAGERSLDLVNISTFAVTKCNEPPV